MTTEGGNDTVNATGAQLAGSTIATGSGTDTLVITGGGTADLTSAASVTGLERVTLAAATTFTADASALAITGSTGADTVTLGANAAQSYAANGGGDIIALGAAGQTVTGGAGDDTVNVGQDPGSSQIDGGDGAADILGLTASGLDLSGATISNVEVLALNGQAAVSLTAAQLAAFTSITDVPAASNTITVTSGDLSGYSLDADVEFLQLADGTNSVTLLARAEVFTNAGDDTISGSAGEDLINASLGFDTFAGGDGDDTFAFGTDPIRSVEVADLTVITDFQAGVTPGNDRIEIAGETGTFLKGAAADVQPATDYALIVLTDAGYANAAAAEDAYDNAANDTGAAVVVFLNSTTNRVEAFRDVSLNSDNDVGDGAVFAQFSSITDVTGIAAFELANFTFV